LEELFQPGSKRSKQYLYDGKAGEDASAPPFAGSAFNDCHSHTSAERTKADPSIAIGTEKIDRERKLYVWRGQG